MPLPSGPALGVFVFQPFAARGVGNFYDEQLYKPHQTLNFCVTEKYTLVSFRPGWSTIPSAVAIP